MEPSPWFPIASIVALGVVVGVPLAAIFYCMSRKRTHPIRQREYPAWEGWLATYYPKATKEEAAVIRRVLETFAHLARVEPTQLRPGDRIEGSVLQPTWQASLDPESEYGQLYDELGELLRSTDLAEWEISGGDAWETVGDAVDFMLKRLSPTKQGLS